MGTSNAIVVESVKTGVPKGYEVGEAAAMMAKSPLEKANDVLSEQLITVKDENTQLKKKLEEMELKLASYESSQAKSKLASAITTDAIVNGDGGETAAPATEVVEEVRPPE